MRNILGLTQPCEKDCPDRKVGCHDKCEKYLEFRKKLDELRKQERIRTNNYIVRERRK